MNNNLKKYSSFVKNFTIYKLTTFNLQGDLLTKIPNSVCVVNYFSDKFLAFSGPHNKSRIENGKHFLANFRLKYQGWIISDHKNYHKILECNWL